MPNIVQSAVFPTLTLCAEKRLYFRYNALAEISLKERRIDLFKGGKVLTNTYFNGVSITKLKKYTQINQLKFKLSFKGHIKITWKAKELQQGDLVLQENELNSSVRTEVEIALPFWQQLRSGMLFFEVFALDESQLYGFQYLTENKPKRAVKLGIVITHFNRQEILLPAIGRLKTELLADKNYASEVDICVVDNSRNLPEIEAVTVIKNPNLGGSGGFTRGLIHLQHDPQYTHCLFMDDDASCEIESIRRTLFYLAYVNDDNIAISGAMLREVAMNMQHENGGVFNGLCYSVNCHFNLLKVKDILLNDKEQRIDYGAWWFFAFPLNKVKYLSFPYFVRGDDISFSLANQFHILTVNGICSWQTDFAAKSGPLQIYLDQRNHIMHFLHGIVVGGNKKLFIKTSLILFVLNILTGQYESAKASSIAIEDILTGNEFWRNNVDMQAKRQQLLAMTQMEKIQPIAKELRESAVKTNPSEGRLTKIVRILSLNGHLIPMFFFKAQPVWQHKHYGVRLREVFLRKQAVFYVDDEMTQGIVLQHDKGKFFAYSWQHLKLVFKLLKNYKRLQQEYRQSYSELTSESFWQEQFNKNDN